jgi:excisionase family DNA binding protein
MSREEKLRAIPLHERFLLDEETASILCGVSRPTFHKWVSDGMLRPIKMPGGERRNLYRRQDVEGFVQSLGVA